MYKYASLFAVVIAALVNPGRTRADDWPTFMHDKHRSGVTAERLELPLGESWVFKAANKPQPAWPGPAKQDYWHRQFNLRSTVAYDRVFHVVGAGETIFFGSSADDKVYALDALTGRQRWEFFTEGPVRLAPFVSGNNVYVGSDDGYVYCLSHNDGSLLWKHKAVDTDRMIPGNGRIISAWPIRTGLLVDKGNLYFTAGLFPNQGTFLSALNAEDGSVRWKRKVDVSPQGYLLASDERLYVPTGRTNPMIFSRADGKALGELPSAGGTFALLTENVLVTGPGRQSQELNASDVDTKDRIARFGGVRMLVNGPTAYMQSERQISAFNRGRYLELSRRRTALTRQYDKIRDQLRKVGKNTAQAKPLREQLQDLAPQISDLSQRMKACYLWTTECEYPYSMIMAGDVLFAGGENEIAAFGAGDGELIWKASVEGKAYGLSVMNGRLYVSTDEGRINCFIRSGARDDARIVAEKIDASPYPDISQMQRYAQAAKLIIEQTGIEKGYCLALDSSRGRLACELAARSDLKIVCVEEGAGEVAAARKVIDEAGLYGRVVVHHGDSASLPYTDYFANLIVSDKALTGSLAYEVLRVLRPSGGVVALLRSDNPKMLKAPSLSDWQHRSQGDTHLAWARRKQLEGAGDWTHTYAEPGNSACSGDKLIKGNMALQWFGRPGPREMIDRHHRNVPPLYKDGRLFVPGDCVVFAVDAYNGMIEWKIEVPNSRRLGVFLDSGNMAVDDQYLYVAAEDKCYGFDVRTGQRRIVHKIPQLIDSADRDWSYIAYSGDVLFGSGRRKGGSYTETSYEGDNALWYQDMKVVVSDYLFAMDKANGGLLWKYNAGLVLNTTIAIGDGRMYFIETNSPKALTDKLGRMPTKTLFDGGDQHLVALDTQSGKTVFKQKLDVAIFEEPVYLNYAEGTLMLSGSRLADRTVRYHYRAFDARSGDVLWDTDHGTTLNRDGAHGEYNRHPTIIGQTVYAWPYAYNVKTGAKIEGWEFDRRGHGCGGVSASAQGLFWRGGNPWMYDLGPDGGPQQLTKSTRQGCWINIIPAGGLALIPESSSGCTCGFAMQTSLAFIPQ
ncbi:MAG: outer membrane protein assembly factor BamB family protein [Planctomycetota bacterium]|jgi:outer membrane protein assembly factor BamB